MLIRKKAIEEGSDTFYPRNEFVCLLFHSMSNALCNELSPYKGQWPLDAYCCLYLHYVAMVDNFMRVVHFRQRKSCQINKDSLGLYSGKLNIDLWSAFWFKQESVAGFEFAFQFCIFNIILPCMPLIYIGPNLPYVIRFQPCYLLTVRFSPHGSPPVANKPNSFPDLSEFS